MDDTVATAREDFLRARGAETAAEVALDAADAEVAALESLLHAAERRKEAARAALAAAREPVTQDDPWPTEPLCDHYSPPNRCAAAGCPHAPQPVTQDGRTLADYVADLADAGPDTPVDLRRPEYALAVLLHHVDAEWTYLVGRVFDTLAARPSAPTVTEWGVRITDRDGERAVTHGPIPREQAESSRRAWAEWGAERRATLVTREAFATEWREVQP
jgi:hypothetical protein